ncbi:hypothetical protein QL093DRAFT_1344566 [Fusarium oxysporum]|nr:hypothetical protein QL093DRAFT_1344566 [Fusarium oxysporum]
MLIHTKDLNFIQPVLEEYCLKIQAVATNSCTFLQQPFIEPPPPRVGSSKGQAFTTVTVQPTGWPSGPDSLVSTHAPKRLRRSLPFPTPLSSQSPSIIHLPQLLHPQSWVVFVYPPAAAATSHALARLTLLSVSASKRSSTHLANKADVCRRTLQPYSRPCLFVETVPSPREGRVSTPQSHYSFRLPWPCLSINDPQPPSPSTTHLE